MALGSQSNKTEKPYTVKIRIFNGSYGVITVRNTASTQTVRIQDRIFRPGHRSPAVSSVYDFLRRRFFRPGRIEMAAVSDSLSSHSDFHDTLWTAHGNFCQSRA